MALLEALALHDGVHDHDVVWDRFPLRVRWLGDRRGFVLFVRAVAYPLGGIDELVALLSASGVALFAGWQVVTASRQVS